MTHENKITDYLASNGFKDAIVRLHPAQETGEIGPLYVASFPKITRLMSGEEKVLAIGISEEDINADFDTTMLSSVASLKEAVNER